jgi:hypothetical protein
MERSRADGRGRTNFEAFAKTHALNDDCFGSGDEGGLTVETPFGDQSALIRLLTDEQHPQLGHGLNASMMLPVFGNTNEIAAEAASLNFLEASTWTRLQHIGSWYSAHETDDVFRLAFNLFIPNSLYRHGLASIITFWLLRRARWLRETKWPDVADLTMMEIYQKRGFFSRKSALRRRNCASPAAVRIVLLELEIAARLARQAGSRVALI